MSASRRPSRPRLSSLAAREHESRFLQLRGRLEHHLITGAHAFC
jgi:hypothetical protein